MNRRLKRALAASFSPPPPQRKTVFLRTLPQPDLSLGTFLWNQIPYLRKRTWLLSCGVLLPAVWGGSCMNPNVLWITAALLPFVALFLIGISSIALIIRGYKDRAKEENTAWRSWSWPPGFL